MKKLLSVLLLFTILCLNASAQIVNIPDTSFKKYLINSPNNAPIDINNDGEIQISEALEVNTLYITQMYPDTIRDLTGIKAFSNITHLTIQFTTIAELDLSNMINLDLLNCSDNKILTALNTTGCTKLRDLQCSNNMITALDVRHLSNLQTLRSSSFSGVGLTSINVSGLNNLLQLYCDFNKLTSLDVSGLQNLQYLYAGQNQLTSLNVNNCPSLTSLLCGNNQLTSLDIHLAPKLDYLHCGQNNLTTINISGLSKLKYFICNTNQLTSLDLSSLDSLSYFICHENQLSTLDLSNSPYLDVLQCHNNLPLTNIGIKNGSSILQLQHLLLTIGNPNLKYVCVDNDEVSFIQNYLLQNQRPDVNVGSYCSFTPGGQHNTITGHITYDQNNNGCDVADANAIASKIKLQHTPVEWASTATDSTGLYQFYTKAGNFTITPEFDNPYFDVTPVSSVINFTTLDSIATTNFCIVPNGVHKDVEITLVPAIVARPGFDASYQLIYTNKGTEIISGSIQLDFDDAKLDFLSAAPALSIQNVGELNWNYNDLLPLEKRTIDLSFNLLPPPANNINDTLTIVAAIYPVKNDEFINDNEFVLKQNIIGSFDPNDKACLEGDAVHISKVGDYLHYVIRFQNEGNYYAENVVVRDIMTDHLNWNSMQVTAASHAYTINQTIDNIEFIFKNIKLPAKVDDEPGSHGFIAFKVKINNDVVVGDIIKNAADIYFDFNLPIRTNTTSTLVTIDNPIPVLIEYFTCNKQNNDHILTWKASCTSAGAEFFIEKSNDGLQFNSISNIKATMQRCLLPFNYVDKNPLAGSNYYRIKMASENGRIIYSKIFSLGDPINQLSMSVSSVVISGNGSAYLTIQSEKNRQLQYLLSDVAGRIIQKGNKQIPAGNSILELNTKNIAAGIYTITVYSTDGMTKTQRFIKQ